MMDWEDVRVQLIDTPPITADYLERYLPGMIQSADAALLLLDLGDDDGPFAAETVIERLAKTKTFLAGDPNKETGEAEKCRGDEQKNQVSPSPLPPLSDSLQLGGAKTRSLVIGNKIDLPDAANRLEIVRELFGPRFPIHVISAEHGAGLEDLRTVIYRFLNVIRVYTKQPGKPADLTSPFTCPIGSTLVEMAALVHRDFAQGLKSARIWGTGVYDGQSVKRDHVLHDKDIVELHL